MIITAYNQHVRLLSSEPFGGLCFQRLLGRREPTLLWNHFTKIRFVATGMGEIGEIGFSTVAVQRKATTPVPVTCVRVQPLNLFQDFWEAAVDTLLSVERCLISSHVFHR